MTFRRLSRGELLDTRLRGRPSTLFRPRKERVRDYHPQNSMTAFCSAFTRLRRAMSGDRVPIYAATRGRLRVWKQKTTARQQRIEEILGSRA